MNDRISEYYYIIKLDGIDRYVSNSSDRSLTYTSTLNAACKYRLFTAAQNAVEKINNGLNHVIVGVDVTYTIKEFIHD